MAGTKRYVSKKEQQRRLNASFASYNKEWYAWKNKGYAMTESRPMSKSEYKKAYDLARRIKGPKKLSNVAKAIAGADRIVTFEEAKGIKKQLLEIESRDPSIANKISKKVGTVRQITSNIDRYSYDLQGKTYTGRQAFYLELKFEYGEEEADEVFGY